MCRPHDQHHRVYSCTDQNHTTAMVVVEKSGSMYAVTSNASTTEIVPKMWKMKDQILTVRQCAEELYTCSPSLITVRNFGKEAVLPYV